MSKPPSFTKSLKLAIRLLEKMRITTNDLELRFDRDMAVEGLKHGLATRERNESRRKPGVQARDR